MASLHTAKNMTRRFAASTEQEINKLFEDKDSESLKTYTKTAQEGNSLRTADAFPVVASLPPKNSDAISDDRKCVCCSQATKGINQPIIAYIVHTHDPNNLCAKDLVPIFDINYEVKNYD